MFLIQAANFIIVTSFLNIRTERLILFPQTYSKEGLDNSSIRLSLKDNLFWLPLSGAYVWLGSLENLGGRVKNGTTRIINKNNTCSLCMVIMILIIAIFDGASYYRTTMADDPQEPAVGPGARAARVSTNYAIINSANHHRRIISVREIINISCKTCDLYYPGKRNFGGVEKGKRGRLIRGKISHYVFSQNNYKKENTEIGMPSIGRVFYIYFFGKILQDNLSFQINKVYMNIMNRMWTLHYCSASGNWFAVHAILFYERGKTAQILWGFGDNVYRYYVHGGHFELKRIHNYHRTFEDNCNVYSYRSIMLFLI